MNASVNRLAVVATPLLSGAIAVLSSTGFVLAEPAPGRVAINVELEAPVDAATRTWRFELVDTAGEVTRSISIPLSGELPGAVAAIDDVPAGDYVLRPVFSSDLGSDCASGAHYRVSSEAAPVSVRPNGTGASFTIAACESTGIPAEVKALPAVMPADPRPFGEPTASHAIGSGATTNTAYNNIVLASGLAAIAAAFVAARLVIARR